MRTHIGRHRSHAATCHEHDRSRPGRQCHCHGRSDSGYERAQSNRVSSVHGC